MAPPFDPIDAYTTQRLVRQFASLGVSGRLRLLKKIQRTNYSIPSELVDEVLAGSDSSLRGWLAANGNFGLQKGEGVSILQGLLHDADPFVRLSTLENRALFGGRFTEDGFGLGQFPNIFRRSTHEERLALARNPMMIDQPELVVALFDPDDTTFPLERRERRELVAACLTNRDLTNPHEYAWRRTHEDAISYHDTTLPPEILWRLAPKWFGKYNAIPELIYQHIPLGSYEKAILYRECAEPQLRASMLRASASVVRQAD